MRFPKMIVAALAAWVLPMAVWAQVVVPTGNAVVGGVGISTDGVLSYRQTTPLTPAAGQKPDWVYVSLPGALAQWRQAKDAGNEAPAEVRYLKGLTRIVNVFVYPADHDIVLAGPAEPFKADNVLEPLGTITGRPVVQLEDLVVTLRAVQNGAPGAAGGSGARGGGFYGCSLENPTNFQEVWNATLTKFATAPRNTLLAEMKKALGPQVVKIYGVPEDARLALTMLAADYRLKRLSMGVETVPGLGNALGTEVAAPRIWFEPAYEPLLVAPDGNAYELRGPRLKVLAAPQQFNPQGANEAQKRFGENFSNKMGDVATKIQAVADLQNVTDCFMVAALIRQDRLAEKAGVDFTWLLSAEDAGRYKTATLPVPKTAETVVRISGNVIAQGGVSLALTSLTGVPRENDAKTAFSAPAARPAQGWFLVKEK